MKSAMAYLTFCKCFLTTVTWIFVIKVVVTSAGEPLVKTSLGSITGHHKYSQNGRIYDAYEGIPYAQQPIRELRFEPPRPIQPWIGELQATKMAAGCLQLDHFEKDENGEFLVFGSEDCLYLNVYVPRIKQKEHSTGLPVIIYFHGGAFMFGLTSLYGPKYFMDKDVILVTVQYRLGPLGFLSTEDNVVPGNMGLKDQNMALRWVNAHIEHFGGDPKKITITGCSAGGASVHYHYLSPLSAGLFRNGISMSGTTLNSWVQMENGAEKAKKLGSLLGCPTQCNKEMIKCLQSRPGRTVVEAAKHFLPWLYNPFTPFGPTVEKSSDQPFIDRAPIDIIKSGDVQDVPWIAGVTKEEGLYPGGDFVDNGERLNDLDENWKDIAPFLLDFNYTIPRDQLHKVSKKIRNYYLGAKKIDKSTARQVVKIVGDRLFIADVIKAAKLQASVNKSPVWFYYYTYRAKGSLSDAMTGSSEDFGVSHADDVLMIFDTSLLNPTTTDTDRRMQETLLHLWETYADKSVPPASLSENWKPLSKNIKDDFGFLVISKPQNNEIRVDNHLGEQSFWNSIGFQENIGEEGEYSETVKQEL